jgi:hypothetical protein
MPLPADYVAGFSAISSSPTKSLQGSSCAAASGAPSESRTSGDWLLVWTEYLCHANRDVFGLGEIERLGRQQRIIDDVGNAHGQFRTGLY